jgi:hypothetical protein
MPEAISQMFSTPQGLASGIGAATNLASAGSGLYNTYQNQLRSLAQNPAAMQKYAAGFTQPLAAGLTQGVNNQAQAYAAERGLASSPGLEQQIENQAIAPYIQQQQNQGMQNAIQALGLGGGATPTQNQASSFNQLGSGLQGLLKLMNPAQATPATLNPNSGSDPMGLTFNPSSMGYNTMPGPVPDLTNYAYGGGGSDQGANS